MKKIGSTICAALIACTSMAAAVSSANAAPLPVKIPQAKAPIHDVQFRRDHDRHRHVDRHRIHRPRFEHRGGWAYYNGHRGYREYRRGYRQHNGWWFPPAAFVAGAVIGSAIASQAAAPPVYAAPVRLSAAHVDWCQARWKSYRVSDNTYQPYDGPRQACVSPYGG